LARIIGIQTQDFDCKFHRMPFFEMHKQMPSRRFVTIAFVPLEILSVLTKCFYSQNDVDEDELFFSLQGKCVQSVLQYV